MDPRLFCMDPRSHNAMHSGKGLKFHLTTPQGTGFEISDKDCHGVFTNWCIYLGLSHVQVTVTTRILPFLVGDPYKP